MVAPEKITMNSRRVYNRTYKKTFFNDVRSKSITVVGNSLSLFDREYGADIDDHDLVIRFNKPAILLSNDVANSHGTKFDLWAFWTIGAFQRKILNTKSWNTKMSDAFANKKIRKIQSKVNGYTFLTKRYVDYTFELNAYRVLKTSIETISNTQNVTPSVGLSVLEWLRLSKPSKVSIYGFDFKKTPTFSEIDRHKVDMENRFDTRCLHDFGAEEQYVSNVILKDERFDLFL